jgi:hypothetical protein
MVPDRITSTNVICVSYHNAEIAASEQRPGTGVAFQTPDSTGVSGILLLGLLLLVAEVP